PGLHVRCLGRVPQRHPHSPAVRRVGPERRPSRLDRYRQPAGHGTGRVCVGDDCRPHWTQSCFHRHTGGLCTLHGGRGTHHRYRRLCCTAFRRRIRTRWCHTGGLCPGRRIHPTKTPRPSAHSHGCLVADRIRPCRI